MSHVSILVSELKPGMLADLEGDAYADPHREEEVLAAGYVMVSGVREVENGKYTVTFVDFDRVIFPGNHLINVPASFEKEGPPAEGEAA